MDASQRLHLSQCDPGLKGNDHVTLVFSVDAQWRMVNNTGPVLRMCVILPIC